MLWQRQTGVTPELPSLTPRGDATAPAHPQECGIPARQWDVLLEHQETPWATQQWSTVILVLLFCSLTMAA